MSNTIRELTDAAGGVVEVIVDQPHIGRDEPARSMNLGVEVRDEDRLRARGIDALVNAAVFGAPAEQAAARWLIWETAQALGIHPASIHELYTARGRGALPRTFTTPAMNIRMMAYETARAALSAAVAGEVGAFIFEVARSEMNYTGQRPAEYATVMLAAAIKEGFRGALFIQGDHFQINAKRWKTEAGAERSALRELIREAVGAGFFNIDIDASTLVDLSRPTLVEQQALNAALTAEFSDLIREGQPEAVTMSLGGEIGEVGHKNSDVHELRAFMDQYLSRIRRMPGISKISVQTGTSHGGIVLPDGTIADVTIDFQALRDLSVTARNEYGMGGAVQHGASTLPEAAFGKFAEAGAIEVHLATAFQVLAYQHLPAELNDQINQWLLTNYSQERKAGDTDEQFFYKTRKYATGAFKQALWNLPESDRAQIRMVLAERFALLFNRLGVNKTRSAVDTFVNTYEIHKRLQDFGAAEPVMQEDVTGLAD